MRVELIAYTPEADKVVSAAAKLCYSSVAASDIMDGLTEEKMAGFLDKLRTGGHLSPFEHASFTFSIEGVSRVTTHQLVRHRMASFSQQSQRYVENKDSETVVPPSIRDNSAAKAIFEKGADFSHRVYDLLLQAGIPKEDARYILPHGEESSIVVTMNARELLHFFSLRCCNRAQWEIRGVARKMLEEVRKVAPMLFKYAGAACEVTGKCPETHGCGKTLRD